MDGPSSLRLERPAGQCAPTPIQPPNSIDNYQTPPVSSDCLVLLWGWGGREGVFRLAMEIIHRRDPCPTTS